MSASKINLSEPPQFLSILGSQGFNFDSAKGIAEMKFEIGEELTHSNGTIVQGGFITAMLDASGGGVTIIGGTNNSTSTTTSDTYNQQELSSDDKESSGSWWSRVDLTPWN